MALLVLDEFPAELRAAIAINDIIAITAITTNNSTNVNADMFRWYERKNEEVLGLLLEEG